MQHGGGRRHGEILVGHDTRRGPALAAVPVDFQHVVGEGGPEHQILLRNEILRLVRPRDLELGSLRTTKRESEKESEKEGEEREPGFRGRRRRRGDRSRHGEHREVVTY